MTKPLKFAIIMVSKEKGGDKMEAIVLMTALINLATAILVLIKALK